MTTIQDIIDYTETFAPLSLAMDFDNCGLLVGNKKQRVLNALVTLDITPAAVNEAVKLHADLIISHHPVIFSPIKTLNTGSVPYLLAEKGIAALCLHTNLDLSEKFGVNTCLAEALQLKNTECHMHPQQEECLLTGELTEAMSSESFAGFVKAVLNCGVRYTQRDGAIQKVAVSSGAGGDSIYAAHKLEAQALVTGEIKHHQLLDAKEFNITVVDAGHFSTENVVVAPLTEKLQKKFADVQFFPSKSSTNPVNYL